MSTDLYYDRSNDAVPLRKGRDAQSLGSILLYGLLAGAAGVAAMTVAEKLEQTVTKTAQLLRAGPYSGASAAAAIQARR
jgi:hypothetical protein